MNFLTNVIKVLGPRILGAGAAAVSGWIFAKSKGTVQIDAGQAAELVTTMITTYAVTHRAATAVSPNPADAATGRVADGVNRAANDPAAPDAVVIPPKTP